MGALRSAEAKGDPEIIAQFDDYEFLRLLCKGRNRRKETIVAM
jgi:hypothetical protein